MLIFGTKVKILTSDNTFQKQRCEQRMAEMGVIGELLNEIII